MPVKRLISVAVAGLGAFFLGGGLLAGDYSWTGFCTNASEGGLCLNPEWIALGVGLIGLAVYLWTSRLG